MRLGASFLGLAAAALLLSACGEQKVATYRVPKEKDPELPMAGGADASAGQPAGGGSMADTSVPTASGDDLTWTAPAGWQQKPASAMRKATFMVPGAGAGSELSITAFPGDVGGELANVNRWRGQAGLRPLGAQDLDSSVTHVQANGLRFTIVELEPPSGSPAKCILGAIVPVSGSTWFFKLTGGTDAVKAAKAPFLEFLHTVKPPQ
ncbi:MAG TPA: hypothetical protein VGG34_00955 [Opitutaceae bacterium]|jgi:hypothetical protein